MKKLNRRQFTTGLVAAGVAAATPAHAFAARSRIHIIDMGNAPFLDRSQLPRGLDGANACTRPNHLFLEALSNSGVDTVIRYYSDQNNAGLNCKNVTRRERDMLDEHGLGLAIVYQFEGRRKGRYTASQATQDAAFCLQRAQVIGQPSGSTIFFGVDADASLNTDEGVRGYFQTVRRIFGGRYRVGIYAAGARCQLIRDAGLADLFWVPEAPAWAGTRDFLNSGGWSMFQNKTDINNSWMTADMGQTLHIDTNILNPVQVRSIGAFRRDGSEITYDSGRLQAIANARHWVTQPRLDVYAEPNGSAATHVCIARTVHVLRKEGSWALIDTNEDGFEDGYCRTDALAPLSQMPRWKRSSCKLVDI
jgi:hypothetical protein